MAGLMAAVSNGTSALAAPVAFKFATVAPEGSSWMVVMREAADEIKAKTGGNVELKLYPGGIAGDEPDVLRKMRVGQYHGAGFTGVGLGELVSDIRILELPFFYDSLDELHYVRNKLTSHLEEKFRAKGYIFLDWAEPGLVYLLSQKPVRSVADMNGVKMWAWEGDPLADSMLDTFKIAPVRVALQDVLMGLQTGMINAAYAPPLAAMALQWQTKVKFMTAEPMTNSTGAILLTKAQWEKVSASDQALVRQITSKSLKKLEESTTKQNMEAIEKFKQQGIQLVSPDAQARADMFSAGAKVRQELVGKLYSPELLKKVEGLVQEFRASKTAKKPSGKK
ncbi:MAG: hypothetical protein A2X94_03370 [Bdellovibrionales bacterium GWB1_55_8]|nr:MAG: hypothetical protein A2X94_03370 [Bdellovibrionales bacterium GWB1_55_8]